VKNRIFELKKKFIRDLLRLIKTRAPKTVILPRDGDCKSEKFYKRISTIAGLTP
jgi:hypothetical protein